MHKLLTDLVNRLHEVQVIFSRELNAKLDQVFGHGGGEGGEGVAHDGQTARRVSFS